MGWLELKGFEGWDAGGGPGDACSESGACNYNFGVAYVHWHRTRGPSPSWLGVRLVFRSRLTFDLVHNRSRYCLYASPDSSLNLQIIVFSLLKDRVSSIDKTGSWILIYWAWEDGACGGRRRWFLGFAGLKGLSQPMIS